jgi:diguanylate cyclase (GGDEF)-like protein/PAS domain S-box-containing protein
MERPGNSSGWDASYEEEVASEPAIEIVSGRSEAQGVDRPQASADHNDPANMTSREEEERYRYTIALSPLVAWTADAIGGILDVDERGLELTGLTFEQARGRGFFAAVHPEDRPSIARMWRENASLGHPIDNDVRMRLSDGSYRWHRSRAAPRRTPTGEILRWYGTIEDIHERKVAADAIRFAAEHDALTGVWGRAAFYAGLEQAIDRASWAGSDVALLLFDLDNFKQINDQFGHVVGDALLSEVAGRLSGSAGEPVMVGRLGGDEFALFLARPDPESLTQAIGDAIAAFKAPFRHGTITYYCRSSIGVALYPAHGSEVQTLRKNADLALYDAKAAGGGTLRYFRGELRLKMQERLSMLSNARDAVDRDLIVPYYQAKVDLRTDRITGFEALLRWNYPGRGVQLPASIAAAFDDPELSVAIGQQMHERVIADIRNWRDLGIGFGRIAINASAAEFREPGFAEKLLERLARAGVPADCLELEVTERVFLSHSADHVGRIISELSEAGITIALDDFGTGYASLTHLKQFPVNVLKIDRSFVQKVSDCDAAVVSAIIGLGKSLGITTVAEGIETQAQRDQLFAQGCDVGQGYLFTVPIRASEVAPLLVASGDSKLPRERRKGLGRRARDRS